MGSNGNKEGEFSGDDGRKIKRHTQSDSGYEENEKKPRLTIEKTLSELTLSDYEEKKLEEIEKKARLKIEEALSKLRIRFCPSCNVRVTKGPGCNLITCVCGAQFCFKCGKSKEFCDRSSCRKNRNRRGPTSLVRKLCIKLKKRHPQLTFRQCSLIIAKSWTEEHETLESERCDNDSLLLNVPDKAILFF